jgi:hypothetical protein
MAFTEATKAHSHIGDEVPQFLYLLGLLTTSFPVSFLGRQTLPFDVQSLLLNASPVMLNATLLL